MYKMRYKLGLGKVYYHLQKKNLLMNDQIPPEELNKLLEYYEQYGLFGNESNIGEIPSISAENQEKMKKVSKYL